MFSSQILKILRKPLKNHCFFQGFSMILTFQYFFILTPILIKFPQKSINLIPRAPQMDLHWGPQGVLGGLLGPFFASLGPSGDPWVPPWGCPGPSWQHFPQFRCPKSRPRRIFHGFFNDFQEQILNFQYENSRFHTYLPIPYHNYFLSFQALQSLFPSTPPTIQASNPPMGPGGMRGAFRRPLVRRAR